MHQDVRLADIALERRFVFPIARADVVEWLIAHREVIALASVMAVAAVLRFWALDAKAIHHDESLHAQFTYYLFNGQGYRHDPLMHGPFLFHSGTAIYFLFGDGDYTARVLPALFGTILVGMPYFLRKADRLEGGAVCRRAPHILADAALLQPLLPQRHLHRRLDFRHRHLRLALPERPAAALPVHHGGAARP
jgi:hypothetical protein